MIVECTKLYYHTMSNQTPTNIFRENREKFTKIFLFFNL